MDVEAKKEVFRLTTKSPKNLQELTLEIIIKPAPADIERMFNAITVQDNLAFKGIVEGITPRGQKVHKEMSFKVADPRESHNSF